MRDYFIRRLLLIPPTLLGVTLLVFTITRFVPGGPMERALQEAQKATEGGGSSSGQIGGGMSEEQVEELEEEYGFDKPIIQAYLQWLGILPRERRLSKSEFRELGKDKVGGDFVGDSNNTLVLLKGSGRQAKVSRKGAVVTSATYLDNNRPIAPDGWEVRLETAADRQERWSCRSGEDLSKAPRNYDDRAIVYKTRFAGLLQGDLGRSTDFGDPVWNLIKGRIPVALYFGILTCPHYLRGVSSARDPQGDPASHHDRQLDLRSYFRGVCHSRFRPWRSYAGLLGGEGRVVSPFWAHRPEFRRHGDMGSVRRPASSHRTASALLRGGRLCLAYHDDEEQPHGQLGRRLRQDGGRQRRVVPKRRFQACLPQFVYSHRLHPRTTDYHLGQREHPHRVRFRYSGVWASAVSGSFGQRSNGDHGNPDHSRLPPCLGQHPFRPDRGHGGPAG